MRFPLPSDFRSISQLPIKVSLADSDRQLFKDFTRSTLIYIRNLGLKTQDLDLSFDGISYDEKQKLMVQYLFGDIKCQIKELDESWAKALRQKCQCDYQDLNSIFSIDEQQKFAASSEENIIEALQNIKTGVIQSIEESEDQEETTMSQRFPANSFNMLESYGEYLEFIPWAKSISMSSRKLTSEQRSQILRCSKSAILLYGQKTSLAGIMNSLLAQMK